MAVSDVIPEILVLALSGCWLPLPLPAPMNPAQACYECHAFVSIRCYINYYVITTMACLLGYHHSVVTQPDCGLLILDNLSRPIFPMK
ncbi:hypothetical protein BP00DRAFT_421323 [Aspergillus indologenus CBS 114.80]|uniref:Uncharacterized protein n=1 Tax=Aspergillus indologenus CBS 114.80 TaxID=1450541 RepID=A0A2V5JIW4_9EURO|nr:hypothetical protein BP00DRAFT_421323 [Aspergillus indologenus CBS 114.80]